MGRHLVTRLISVGEISLLIVNSGHTNRLVLNTFANEECPIHFQMPPDADPTHMGTSSLQSDKQCRPLLLRQGTVSSV